MLTKPTHDVVVVGAGPAGCAAAYYSASRGMKTLILEKESLPRYKPCGGGVNLRAAQLLPFDFSPVVERCVHGGELSCRLGLAFAKSYIQPITYMTMRDRLDQFLCQKAVDAGAEILDGARVDTIVEENDRVSVSAGRHRVQGRFLCWR